MIQEPGSLFIIVAVCFNTYEGFVGCIEKLRSCILEKDGIEKKYRLKVDFDRNSYFSTESKRKRRFKQQSALTRREEYQSKQKKEMKKKKREEMEAQFLRETLTIIQQTSLEIESLFSQYSEYSDSRLQELWDLFIAIKAESTTSSRQAEQVKKRFLQLKMDVKHAGDAAIHTSHVRMIHNIRQVIKRAHECMKVYRSEMETSRSGDHSSSEWKWMKETRLKCESLHSCFQKLHSREILNRYDQLCNDIQEYDEEVNEVCCCELIQL